MITKVALPVIVLFLSFLVPLQESHAQITGRVRDANNQPIPQVNIVVQNTNRGTQTNSLGTYTIQANPGEILVFSHIAMQSRELQLEKSPSVLNVQMQPASISLEEVEIEARRRQGYKSQKELLAEYPSNKKLIKTTLGILDQDLSSTYFRIVDGEDLVPVGTDFFFSFEAHIPQLRIVRDDPYKPGVHVYLRGVEPLFDVDGFVTPAPPTYLSALDIDRIAVLERNAAIARYGPQAAPGVIVVNTKAQTQMDDAGIIRTYDNRSLVKSLIKEAGQPESYQPHTPSFMKELLEAATEAQAQSLFTAQKVQHQNNPYYFLEACDYFLERWGNQKIPKELCQNITESFSEDIAVQKALAYLLQKYGEYERALNVYLEILKLRYDQVQSHRDVANAYAELGDYEKSWMYYTQYIDIMDQLPHASFDAYGEDLLITTEMMNILDRRKESFVDRDRTGTLEDSGDPQTRLVFEWNNPEAKFELQFVTPEGYYDSWSTEPDVSGYSSKQFFIGQEDNGEWQVNTDYTGNLFKMPTYLKVSIYRDYGLPSQQIDIKVYKLSEIHEKVQLFTLQQN